MRFFMLFCLSIALVACAGGGSTALRGVDEDDVRKQLVEGKTTREEVRELFGSPLETTYTSEGMEIWKYSFDDTSGLNLENVASKTLTLGLAGGVMKGTRNELIILFDEDYKIKRFNMSNSEVRHGTGLFK